MGNPGIVTSFIAVLCIDVILLLAQFAITDINPDSGFTFFTGEGSFSQQANSGNYVLNTSYADKLPGVATGGTVVDTGLSIVDTFNSARNWITTAGKMILAFLAGPYFILSAIQAPQIICFAVGTVWFFSNLILLIAFIFGRN